MRFGVAIFPTDYAISMTELGPAAEDLGFESLWVAEHSHIPTSRRSPYPAGGELPKPYWHTLDPFVALTAAACATKRIKVGTGICLLIERDPIHTAKETASLDHVSGGRFIFGIGGGWNREEMADHGTDFSTRWKLLRERTEAIKAIWTTDPAEYHGDMVDFGPMWSFPKPLQKPHPPVILGGSGPKALERVVRYADGWMPNRGDVFTRIDELQRMAMEAGRGRIPVTYYPKATPEEIERCAEAGIERCIWYVPADGRDAALRRLEELGKLVRSYAEKAA
ncbi:MAG TPA: LLM class F420-dependent oxidoreductase [Candidatus Dormibacteraeota bacterium]|nr:LLM class F420-dependent oxidoreductase [Candidatus Dormibacteraeota bacterium]